MKIFTYVTETHQTFFSRPGLPDIFMAKMAVFWKSCGQNYKILQLW